MSKRSRVTVVVAILMLLIGTTVVIKLADSDDQLRTITIGYIPIADCPPLLNEAVFARHGIRLQLEVPASGAVILPSVIDGGFDVGFTNLVSRLLARAQGIDLVAFAGCTYEDAEHARHGLMTMPGSEIHEPSQLKAKTVAVNTLRNIDHLLLNRWMRAHELLQDDVTLIEVPFPRMDTVLQKKDLDAIAVVEPFLTKARLNDRSLLSDYFIFKDNTYVEVTSYCATGRWLQANRQFAFDFGDALAESVQLAQTDVITPRLTEPHRRVTGAI